MAWVRWSRSSRSDCLAPGSGLHTTSCASAWGSRSDRVGWGVEGFNSRNWTIFLPSSGMWKPWGSPVNWSGLLQNWEDFAGEIRPRGRGDLAETVGRTSSVVHIGHRRVAARCGEWACLSPVCGGDLHRICAADDVDLRRISPGGASCVSAGVSRVSSQDGDGTSATWRLSAAQLRVMVNRTVPHRNCVAPARRSMLSSTR